MKIITIIGARPQFIKAAVVSRAIAAHNQLNPDKKIIEIIIHTGQHHDTNMSDIFFKEMKIPHPDYHLDIHGLGHGAMTGRMLEGIEKILLLEKPDWVLVYGDTNSTLAGALAASKLHIRVAHVEAGLRSFNMRMPEEINRILTDRISTILFCPTEQAVQNLQKEGFADFNSAIENCGDVMLDAAMFYREFEKPPAFNLPEEFILATIHRAENTDELERLRGIIEAFNDISRIIPVILPLHPRTRKILEKENLKTNFTIVDPLGYLEMVYLLARCQLVMTDSGGLQKEAYFFKKPCITLRDETEWVELVQSGCNFLAGANKESILRKFNQTRNHSMVFTESLYGNGAAGKQIVPLLITWVAP